MHVEPAQSKNTIAAAVHITDLRHSYGKRLALDGVSFDIPERSVFGLLGPNGSGKSTLFRLLSTLIPVHDGTVEIFGHNTRTEVMAIRRAIGVVFQSPSLDPILSARENLMHQGHLYGLRGNVLQTRMQELLEMVQLADRANERVSKYSGGLRRRLEIAKSLLHEPRLLILDEPSTGLDPAARRDVWTHVRRLQRERGVTVIFTTHLLEEADAADQVAVLNEGKLVALDTPNALKNAVGGDVLVVTTSNAETLAKDVQARFNLTPLVLDGELHIERADGHTFIAPLVEAFPGRIDTLALRKPDLNDVFFRVTGRHIHDVEVEA